MCPFFFNLKKSYLFCLFIFGCAESLGYAGFQLPLVGLLLRSKGFSSCSQARAVCGDLPGPKMEIKLCIGRQIPNHWPMCPLKPIPCPQWFSGSWTSCKKHGITMIRIELGKRKWMWGSQLRCLCPHLHITVQASFWCPYDTISPIQHSLPCPSLIQGVQEEEAAIKLGFQLASKLIRLSSVLPNKQKFWDFQLNSQHQN